MAPFDRIVVPLDRSPLAERAVPAVPAAPGVPHRDGADAGTVTPRAGAAAVRQ